MCIGEDGMEKVNHPNQSPSGCVMNAMCEKEHGFIVVVIEWFVE